MLMRLMSKGEYLIVPKGTKFTGLGKLGLITTTVGISTLCVNTVYVTHSKTIFLPDKGLIAWQNHLNLKLVLGTQPNITVPLFQHSWIEQDKPQWWKSNGAFRLPSFCIGQRLQILVFCMATRVMHANIRNVQSCCERLASADVDWFTVMKSECTMSDSLLR